MKCVAQISDKPNQSTVYKRACECLGINGLIVLDDLPQLCGDENFSRILVQLGRICQDNNVKLLSTSSYSLPLILQEALREDALRVESIPDLCASETAEILMSYGASIDLINTQAKFLNTLAKGHPQIVVSIARYLQQHQWVIDDYLEESLWRGDYQLPLNEETIQKILKTVSDEYARELLYRLCLPVNRFSSREVTAVATIVRRQYV